MKRIVASLLLVAMLLSMAACKTTPAEFTQETTTTPVSVPVETQPADVGTEPASTEAVTAAAAAVQALYADMDPVTPGDYELVGTITVDGVEYPILWSVDVAEELVKIVDNQDGFFTVDVNELTTEETPYVLTATVTDASGNSCSVSFPCTLPAGIGEGMLAIVDAAYSLEPGAAMTEPVTLIGVITSINAPWSEDYQNISVIIQVAGREDKPILCYRLKGDGAKELAIGDTITVTGIIKNYNGTIEFDTGCSLDAVVKGGNEAPTAPADPAEIVAAAYALKSGESLPYEATLTGSIISVDYAWSDQYGNITVTMLCHGRKIQCYRLKGDSAPYLGVNDQITVKGVLTNYNGTIEFTSGCILVGYVDYAAPSAPSNPHDIIDAAYRLSDYESLPYTCSLTGVITKINTPWDSGYGNITVTIAVAGRENKPIQCYRLKGDGASELQVGDTITVKGTLKNYMGTIEFDSGCQLTNVVKGEGGSGDSEPVESKLPPITEIAEGTEYLLGLIQVTNDHYVFVTGTVSGRYLETTEDPEAAAKVYAEASGEGWKFFLLDGESKLYVDVYLNDEEKTALQYSPEGDVFTLDAETGAWLTELEGTEYYIGSYSTFDTISVSKSSYISSTNAGISQFPAGFFPTDFVPPVDGEEEEPPVVPEKPEITPEENKAYKLGMYQGNLGATLYITGNTANQAYYLETTEDITAAIDVYVEMPEGGSRLYFTKDGVKTYIDVIVNGTYVNISLTQTPTTLYVWNEEYQTFVTTVTVGEEQVEYYLGTYNTFNTLSASKLSYAATSFPATLYDPDAVTEEPGEPDTPDTPEAPEEPETPDYSSFLVAEPQESKAYKLGMLQGNLEKHLFITGSTANKDYYLATAETPAEAIDVYVEAVEGGYRLYFTKDGIKTYIDVIVSGTYVNISLTDAPTAVYVWNSEYKTFVTTVTVGEELVEYYLGTYNTFDTLSASKLSYAATSFPANLYDFSADVTPEEPEEPELPETSGPKENQAYYLTLEQELLGKTLYFTGATANKSYYLATSEDAAEAVAVYVEAVEGGYQLFFTKDGVKTYVDIAASGSYVNAGLTEAPTAVLRWNDVYQTFVTTVGEADYFLGTYESYATISASSFEYISTSFAVTLQETVVPEEPETPVEPEQPEEPEIPSGQIVIYYPNGSTYVTAEQYDYTSSSGAVKAELVLSESKDDAAVFTKVEQEGLVSFVTPEGQYLYCDGTNVKLVSEQGEYTVFTAEAAENGWFLKSAALYNNDPAKPQYLEVYNGYLTCYGMGSNTAIYTFTFESAQSGEVTPPEGTEPEEPETPETPDFVPGKAYKLGMFQGNVEKTLYITGETANKDYYLATTEDVSAAIDVYVEAAEGGYRLYFTKDGGKTYIDVIVSGTYVNISLTQSPTAVYVWNSEYKTFVTTVTVSEAPVEYYLGTYGTYETVSASKLSYAATSFPATLYTADATETPEEPEVPEEPETPVEPEAPQVTPVSSPAENTAYKLGMFQGNVEKTLFITGSTANKDYYLATTEDVSAAIDVYVEAAEGGYRLYFIKDGGKTYIDVIVSGTYVNISLTQSPTAVYVWNSEYKTFVTTVTVSEAPVEYYLGTYNTFETLSASKLSYAATSFPATLYIAE